MKFIIEMDCDNAAFHPNARDEIARILRDAVKRLDRERASLFDINGNRVGFWRIEQ
jgi:hypothetical protein